MPSSTVADDIFSAIAEPRRRRIIEHLADGRCSPVNDIVEGLGMPQPTVSKHLAVLREVGIVTVTRRGRQRLYELDAERLKPVYDWSKSFEKFWSRQLGSIKSRAEGRARGSSAVESGTG